MKKWFALLVLAVLLVSVVGWTTNKSSGSRRVFLNIVAEDVYYFPQSGTANLTTYTQATAWSPSFISIARYSGADICTMLVYSSTFNGGVDSVFVGPIVVEVVGQVDSINASGLGTSLVQIEGSN